MLFAALFITIAVKSQQYFTSYKNNFVVIKQGKFLTQKQNINQIDFILNDNILYVDDIAESRYIIFDSPKKNYDNIGTYTTFSAIDEKDRRCSIILFKPNDQNISSMLSVVYDNWGVVYFIK